MLIKLAFRNIFRNFKRTAITFGAIGVALDPQKDSAVFKLAEAVEKGVYLSSGTEEAMLIGEGGGGRGAVQAGRKLY